MADRCGGTLIGAGPDQRLYVQTDVRGSTTSIASVSGAVVERYLYGGQKTGQSLMAST